MTMYIHKIICFNPFKGEICKTALVQDTQHMIIYFCHTGITPSRPFVQKVIIYKGQV